MRELDGFAAEFLAVVDVGVGGEGLCWGAGGSGRGAGGEELQVALF